MEQPEITEVPQEIPIPEKKKSRKRKSKEPKDVTLQKPKMAWMYMILKKKRRNFRLSERAIHAVSEMCYKTASKICAQAALIAKTARKKTIQTDDMIGGIKMMVPEGLNTKCISKGKIAIEACKKHQLKVHPKYIGLIFGVGQSRNLVKTKGENMKVSTTALVMLAACQEKLATELLMLSADVTKNRDMQTIKFQCVEIAATQNEHFKKLW